MRPVKTRYQLWQIMLAIGVLAGLFAVFEVVFTFELLIVNGVVLLPILRAAPGRKPRTALWISSLYPWLFFGSFSVIWFTAWCVLDHRPSLPLLDPIEIRSFIDAAGALPYLFVTGLPAVWYICVPLMIAEACGDLAQRRTRPGSGAVQLLIPFFSWVSFFIVVLVIVLVGAR